MANKPRTKAKPITEHQLFPAVVALWFGALFGLGSLAIRPSLIENLVIASRIDLLVPAAAPPLGVTARILIALALAAIGSAIGIAIGRRIARPKQEQRERKRNSFAADEGPVLRPAYASPDPAIEDRGNDGTQGILAARRRLLAIEHPEEQFVPQEMAPLPGGAPQILDISSVGIGSESAEAALDLGHYEEQQPASAMPSEQVHREAEAAAAAADGRQVFGMPAPREQVSVPRQIFGQKIEDDHVPAEFVREAGFKTTVFDTPEPNPLFPARQSVPETEAATTFAVPAAPEVPQYTVPAAEIPTASVAEAGEPAAKNAEPPVEAELPSPAGLGMTDLAARLAESMARRRAARAEQSTPAEQSAPSEPEVPALEQTAALPVAQETAAIAPTPAAEPFEQEASQPAITAPAAIPQAMRPLELDGFEDEDEDLASFLPPRRISLPESPAIAEPPPAPFELTDMAHDTDVEVEVEVAEGSYASLLGIAAAPAPAPVPTPDRIRIEEPEDHPDAIEPVVIFPGQLARAAESEAVPFRRFDAPDQAGQGQPVAASETALAVDREESERALRLALANLQRMSGAA